MQPHAHREDQPERAERAGEQLAEVVAGDVLDHLAARLGERAVAERDRDPENQIARLAVAMAQRTAVGGREHAADRRAIGSVGRQRRVEREHLAGCRQLPLRPRERHAGLEDRRQVAGVVLERRVQAAGVQLERGRVAGHAPVALGGAADDPHRRRRPRPRRASAAAAESKSPGVSRSGVIAVDGSLELVAPTSRSRSQRTLRASAGSGVSPQSVGAGISLPGIGQAAGIERAAQALERVEVARH